MVLEFFWVQSVCAAPVVRLEVVDCEVSEEEAVDAGGFENAGIWISVDGLEIGTSAGGIGK